MEDRTKVSKLMKSATDRLPIIAEIARKECLKKGPKVVWRRSMKLIYSYYYYLALALAITITICM